MSQYQLFEDGCFQSVYEITYSGESNQLKEHSIDALLYAQSVSGYSIFIQQVATALDIEVDVVVVAENESSFKTTVKTGWRVLEGAAIAFTILSWFGVDYKSVKETVDEYQKCIVRTILEEPRGLDSLIDKVRNSHVFTEAEKEKIISALADKKLRRALDDFTKPLDRNGYSIISAKTEDKHLFEISEEDRDKFKFTPPPEETIEPFSETVKIVYLSPDLNRWMFKGKKEFWADVLDIEFINRVNSKKSSELKNVLFWAVGRRITILREGEKRKSITWEIDSIEELQQQHVLT